MPRLSVLSAWHLELCDNTLKSRDLIAPNKALIAAIVCKHPTLVRLLVTGYKTRPARISHMPTLDTYEREYLLDAVAEEYTKEHWPFNCDSDDFVKSFSRKLIENASQAGWVFKG